MDGQTDPNPNSVEEKMRISFHLLGGGVQTYLIMCTSYWPSISTGSQHRGGVSYHHTCSGQIHDFISTAEICSKASSLTQQV